MKRLSILISLSFSLFFPSCQTVREVAEIPAADPVERILINGDVFVEKENPNPILFSPDMKEYRLYGEAAAVIAEKYNRNIVYLKGIPGETRDPDGRIPFQVLEILQGGRP